MNSRPLESEGKIGSAPSLSDIAQGSEACATRPQMPHPWVVEITQHAGLAVGVQTLVFDDEPAAKRAYDEIRAAAKASRDRLNDATDEIEVGDAIGRGTYPTRDIHGVRLFDARTLIERQAVGRALGRYAFLGCVAQPTDQPGKPDSDGSDTNPSRGQE